MGADLGVVEAVESEREMIQVAAPGSRRCAAHRAELARDGDKIDQGVTGAKLIEADLRLLALIGAAENLLVEAAHPVEVDDAQHDMVERSEEHTSELQSLMRISYAVFCLKKKNKHNTHNSTQ